jgi:cytochrome c biogenesis protein CcdA
MGLIMVVIFVVLFFTSGSREAVFFEHALQGTRWLLPIVAVAALVDSINPCAFSVLILTIAFLLSLGKLRSSILWTGASYISGIFIVYILIGLGILQTLSLFNVPHAMAKVGALILIAFGSLNLINEFFPSFPISLGIPQRAHTRIAILMEKGSVPAAFILGVVVGLFEFPCTGGPYLMILGLLHDKQTSLNGFLYLVFYNFIFVFPLILILLLASDTSVLATFDRLRKQNTRNMRFWGGMITILLGVLIFVLN